MGKLTVNGKYHLVSSNMAGWKIPELNGGFNRITYPFSIAMFDYRRVSSVRRNGRAVGMDMDGISPQPALHEELPNRFSDS